MMTFAPVAAGPRGTRSRAAADPAGPVGNMGEVEREGEAGSHRPGPDGRGDGDAGEWDAIYRKLYELARWRMSRQAADHTLQATALVHEAFLKLERGEGPLPAEHDELVALAASAMRSVLVDHARAKGRTKRPPRERRVELDDFAASYEARAHDLLALDEALVRLAGFDPRMARLVELRFFGGLTMEELAGVLDLPKRTAEREWQTARAWLRRELEAS